MAKIFKPRRGQKSTMSTTKANTVLANGEMFVEFDGPVGSSEAAIKFGDGTSAYSALPYALKNTDVSSAQVTVTTDNSSTSTAALNNVTTGATTGAIVGSLKQAISLTKNELTNTIDDLSQNISGRLAANNVGFYFDYQNGEYGYNTSANRGADTFSPFKNGSYTFPVIIQIYTAHTASAPQGTSCAARIPIIGSLLKATQIITSSLNNNRTPNQLLLRDANQNTISTLTTNGDNDVSLYSSQTWDNIAEIYFLASHYTAKSSSVTSAGTVTFKIT